MDIFRFDRSDRIGTELVLGLVWLSAAISQLLEPVSRWARGLPLLIDSGDPATSRLPMDGATWVERGIMLVVPILGVAGLGVGAWLIVRLLRSIAGGDPFVDGQVTRLRTIALLLIAVPTVLAPGSAVATAAVQARLDQEVDATFTLPIAWLLAGLLAAAVAQAFATGAALRNDVDGLV